MGNIWGLVLAGGKSSRMGKSKALLPYKGQRLVDVVVSLLKETTLQPDRVLVSGNISGHTCVQDEIPDRGPLEGVRCALTKIADGDVLLVVPVDMPLLTAEALRTLLDSITPTCNFTRFTESELPCAFVVSDRVRRTGVALCADTVLDGERSFKTLFSLLQGKTIPCDKPQTLCNTNTPEEWMEVVE